ncbi:MAG: membrane dipeptidase [Myxococcales bacterium]|nr:membrane dipeptidase [Myxococcales bacterium]
MNDAPTPEEAAAVAARVGCSTAAVELVRACEVIDLHIDTLIPPRLWGYDLRRQNRAPFGGLFFGHLDLPRMQAGGLSGAMWSITTNPARTPRGRLRTFHRNLARLRGLVDESEGKLAFARTAAEYRAARATGAHAVMLAIQGGNALDAAPDGPEAVPDRLLTRVTLVHLTNSGLGVTSSPASKWKGQRGISDHGKRFVEQLAAARVFLDLAHIHPDGFWQALDAHDRALPPIVTHTGVNGVNPHWRNLDDAQIRAIAELGGVIGVMAQRSFLRRKGGPADGAMLVEHMEHIVNVAGEDAVAVGTDFDGAITPPVDIRSGDVAYYRLVEHMLTRGWPEGRIRKALGENYLKSFERLRPE